MVGRRRTPSKVGAAAATSIAAMLVVSASACTSGNGETSVTTVAPSATDDETTSSEPLSAADDPALIDWAAIVTELDQRRTAAQQDPTVDSVATFCAPTSECNEQWVDSIDYLLDNDLRMVGGQSDEVTRVAYAGTLDGSPLSEAFEVVLQVERIAAEQGVVQLVNSDGSVERELRPDDDAPPGTVIPEVVVLQRQTLTSEWLVFEAN